MKRNIVLSLLPIALFALERVNLIKDAGFEKDSEVWLTYTGRDDGRPDSAMAKKHDPEKFFAGGFSGSCDTRMPDGDVVHGDSAIIIQGFCCPKKGSDLDSLFMQYSVVPYEDNYYRSLGATITLYLNAGNPDAIIVGYLLRRPTNLMTSMNANTQYLDIFIFPTDTNWHNFNENIGADLITEGFGSYTVDSFILGGGGAYTPPWFGQKVYWDDIRLTGYADYDVGVKEILSGDSVWAGVYYKPIARIKSFGRQAADDFLAIAEIRQGETLVWADTIPYTLPADTEDTLEFDSFPIPNALDYTLTVRTVMSPDESDEDDQVSKPLYGTAVLEQPESSAITLEVESFTANPRIHYSLPQSQSGTISIYDATGRKVESRKVQGSGEVEFPFALSSGVYFVKLESGKASVMRKTVAFR